MQTRTIIDYGLIAAVAIFMLIALKGCPITRDAPLYDYEPITRQK